MSLDGWLGRQQLDGFSFVAIRWTEQLTSQGDDLADALGREVLDNYVQRDWLERRLKSMGYDRLAEHVRSTLLPPSGNTRTGDFGEIVAAHIMERHLGYFVPVRRLRYKDSPSGTQRLLDLVAFKFRTAPEPTTVALSEVKTRTGPAASIATDAAQQLADAIVDLPLSLSYIDRRLTEEGKHFYADLVVALLDPETEHLLDLHVVLITDADVLHAETLTRLENSDVDKELTTSVVLIESLSDVIANTYATAGELRGLSS